MLSRASALLASSFSVALLPACGGSSPGAAAPSPAAASAAPSSPSRAAETAAFPGPKAAVEREPESVVGLSLEPLAAGIRPGGKVVLAAHFRIAPGYRISWKAAGEVGTPTSVTFRAPPGFEVGPVQFPVPDRYTTAGGGGIGYENETAVFVEVKAPGNLRRDDANRFDLDATWVACKRTCATERTAAFVELATTYGDARVRETEGTMAPFRARLPRPLRELKGADASWERGPRDATLVVKVPGAIPRDFFSDGSADPKPEKTALSDGELRFVYDEAPPPGSRPLRGVIVVTVDGKDAFYELEAPLPEEDAAGQAEGKTRPGKPGKVSKKR